VQDEDHREDQRDVRDVAALDLVVDRGEDAHDAARHHELDARVHEFVGWYFGVGSTDFRSWTIRSLVLTATARMPCSWLSQ